MRKAILVLFCLMNSSFVEAAGKDPGKDPRKDKEKEEPLRKLTRPPRDFHTMYLDFCLMNNANQQCVMMMRIKNDPVGNALFCGYAGGNSAIEALRETVRVMTGWVHMDGNKDSKWRNIKITLMRGAGMHAILVWMWIWMKTNRLDDSHLQIMGPTPIAYPGAPVPDLLGDGPFLLTFSPEAMRDFDVSDALNKMDEQGPGAAGMPGPSTANGWVNGHGEPWGGANSPSTNPDWASETINSMILSMAGLNSKGECATPVPGIRTPLLHLQQEVIKAFKTNNLHMFHNFKCVKRACWFAAGDTDDENDEPNDEPVKPVDDDDDKKKRKMPMPPKAPKKEEFKRPKPTGSKGQGSSKDPDDDDFEENQLLHLRKSEKGKAPLKSQTMVIIKRTHEPPKAAPPAPKPEPVARSLPFKDPPMAPVAEKMAPGVQVALAKKRRSYTSWDYGEEDWLLFMWVNDMWALNKYSTWADFLAHCLDELEDGDDCPIKPAHKDYQMMRNKLKLLLQKYNLNFRDTWRNIPEESLDERIADLINNHYGSPEVQEVDDDDDPAGDTEDEVEASIEEINRTAKDDGPPEPDDDDVPTPDDYDYTGDTDEDEVEVICHKEDKTQRM